MQNYFTAKKWIAAALLGAAFCLPARAQTTYLQLGQEDYQLLDRLETRSGAFSNDLFSTFKPIPRKGAVRFLEQTQQQSQGLSRIDQERVARAISVSGEWASGGAGAIDSRTPWFNTFYKKQPDFFSIQNPDFFLSVNPVLTAQGIYEQAPGGGSRSLWASSRGIETRGLVADRLGFYLFFTDNQEQPPQFVNDWIARHDAVPGADYYQTPGGNKHATFDYLQSRGYVDVAAIPDHLNLTFGYDRHFIGDGMRSLFLSDFAAGATFLKLTTRFWKLNYQNLYLELTPQYERGADRRLPHKYATMHHLSANLAPWLNLGLFEGVMFSRPDRYEFSYMVPVIFYRHIERALGSPDNAFMGLNFKAIAARHLQFYGQLMLDELRVSELSAGNGWYGNKFGVQLGAKYFDAFTVPNLDLQAELNVVRPFTYSHADTLANYTHYNQPLAHPLGAGFRELTAIARYQPHADVYLSLKGTYYQRGLDTGAANYGNDIFKSYNSFSRLYGNTLINGPEAKGLLLNINASWELRENLFLDLGATRRMYEGMDVAGGSSETTYFYGGLRLNLARRDYDFF